MNNDLLVAAELGAAVTIACIIAAVFCNPWQLATAIFTAIFTILFFVEYKHQKHKENGKTRKENR